METSELLLTIFCGILIAWVVTNHGRKKVQPGRMSTAPSKGPAIAAPPTEIPTKPFVVRISGIPPDGDESQVKSLLKTMIAKLSKDESDCINDITVVPSCIEAETLVAIVDFKVLPGFLSSLKECSSRSFRVPGKDHDFLHFDADFSSFTQMYPTEGKPIAE